MLFPVPYIDSFLVDGSTIIHLRLWIPSNTNEDGKEESNEADYDEKPREINHTTTITTNGVF
jgi:hypothetical protein